MRIPGRHFILRRVITCEAIAFTGISLLIWLDELLDLPHWLMWAEATPVNWQESLIESLLVAIIGGVIIFYTCRLFRQMKVLEGILPVCASCKKIRDKKGSWHQIEAYIRDRSDADFSHGICPECAEKLYPGMLKRNK